MIERGKKLKTKNNKWLIHLVLIIGCVIMIFPFLWMLLTAMKSYTEATRIPPTLLPDSWNFINFPKAFHALPFVNMYINTFLMIGFRILFALVFSSMAGYAFAKLDFPFKKFLFSIVLVQMMLPGQIFILPQYSMAAKMGILNSIPALIFPGIVSAFGIFFLRQFYMSLPNELSEAAYLDGCSQIKIFWKIMVPLTKTPLTALAVFTAIFAWSDLMWPLIVNMSVDKMTLAAGIASMKGQFFTDYPLLMAASFIAMIPMLLLYLVFQKQFVEGIAMTGSKS